MISDKQREQDYALLRAIANEIASKTITQIVLEESKLPDTPSMP
jgi:hypothetical protein